MPSSIALAIVAAIGLEGAVAIVAAVVIDMAISYAVSADLDNRP